MARWVILRHELPDGTWHLDWMFEPREGVRPGTRLVTFRIGPGAGRPDDPACGEFRAEMIGEHRADYVTYEGPVSGGRGEVRREAAGDARILCVEPRQIRVQIAGSDGRERLWEGLAEAGAGPAAAGLWTFRLSSGR